MALDEELRTRLREQLSAMDDIEERPMVGGVGFMWRGNLLCGVTSDGLLVRIAKTDYAAFIREKGVKPMVMGGRSATSWILIDKSIVGRQAEMKKWLDRAVGFAGSLPAK